jgi:dTDP-glucose pyrophosphorylase
VILARGLGTRMRRGPRVANLAPAQRAVAATGVKGMIPIERPFLEYAISALADAGITDVCLVIGPEHGSVRDYFTREVNAQRVRVHFALQQAALGTADAVVAAEPFAAGEYVLVVNSDNYYPVHTLRALRELGSAGIAGVAAFERDTLIRESNIDRDRVTRFSVIDADEQDMLRRIIEKPDAATVESMGPEVFVGMNSWCLPPEIYRACRAIPPSPRGEVELPHAVQFAHDHLGVQFGVLKFRDAVLDLSSTGDIAAVAERLRGVVPRL